MNVHFKEKSCFFSFSLPALHFALEKSGVSSGPQRGWKLSKMCFRKVIIQSESVCSVCSPSVCLQEIVTLSAGFIHLSNSLVTVKTVLKVFGSHSGKVTWMLPASITSPRGSWRLLENFEKQISLLSQFCWCSFYSENYSALLCICKGTCVRRRSCFSGRMCCLRWSHEHL